MAPVQYGDVGAVKTRAGVSPDSLGFGTVAELEKFIGDVLDNTTQEINEFVGRTLDFQTGKTVTVDGNRRDSLKLPDYPVENVQSVKVGGHAINSDDYRVTSEGVLERRASPWPDGWENIEVVYDVGYPNGAGAAEEVATEVAVQAVNKAIAARKADGKDSVSMDGYSVSWASTHDAINLDESHKERLRPYREAAVV